MINTSERQCACFNKWKKWGKNFIYKKLDTLQKVRQFALHFYIHKKPDTLRYTIFHEIFGIGIYIQNHDTLRYLTFYIQKARNFAKS